MQNWPLVSSITVNYNQTQVTLELLASLRQITYPDFEVIVVDNASREDPSPAIRAEFSEVKVIVSSENLGFAGGNNLALSEAKGKYLLYLNNDTEVSPDFLEPLVKTMEDNPKIGVCSPKIRFFYKPNTIQYAGSSPLHSLRIASYTYGYGQEDKGQFNLTGPTNLAHGAAMIVSREVIEKAGKMPEEFFLYYEELDWCEIIKRAGYQIYYVSESLVLHKESISTGKSSNLQLYYKTRNRILLARRNLKSLKKWTALSYLSITAIADILKLMLKGDVKRLKVYFDALLWHVQPSAKAKKTFSASTS